MLNLPTKRASGCAGGASRGGPGGRSPPGRPIAAAGARNHWYSDCFVLRATQDLGSRLQR
eukprot:3702975-Alexandrium_andersonii.AAC.1